MKMYDKIECKVQREFASHPQPLIGLEYIVEYEPESGPVAGNLLYCCMLCRKTMSSLAITVTHLTSLKHKQRYIKHHMPAKDAPMLRLSRPERERAITEVIKMCETKFGRLEPWGTVYDIKRKVNSTTTLDDYIRRQIINGKHFGWDKDRDQPTLIDGMIIPFVDFAQGNVPETEKQKKKESEKKTTESVTSVVVPTNRSKPLEKSQKVGKNIKSTKLQTSISQSSKSNYKKKKIHELKKSKSNSKHGTPRSTSSDSSSDSASEVESQRRYGAARTEVTGIAMANFSEASSVSKKEKKKGETEKRKVSEPSGALRSRSRDKNKKRKESESSGALRSRSRDKKKKRKESESIGAHQSRSRKNIRSNSNASSSSNTSDSLSPVARQRGLRPELPQDYCSLLDIWTPAPVLVTPPQPEPQPSTVGELEDNTSDEETAAMHKLMEEMLIEAAEDSYLTNYEEGTHNCTVYHNENLRDGFEELWDHMCDVWFNEQRYVFGLTSESHITEPDRLRMLKRIMMETPISVTMCRPVCRVMVESILTSVNTHQEAHLVTEAQRLMLARGIVRNIQLQLVVVESVSKKDPDFAAEAQKPPWCNEYSTA